MAVQNAKMGWFGEVMGHSRSWGNVTIQQSVYILVFDSNRNYAAILYRFRDIASYLSKVADCNLLHGALAGGDPGCISLRSLATENQSPYAIMDFCLRDPMFSRFSRTPTCDRQTGTWTEHIIYRANIASRGKKSYHNRAPHTAVMLTRDNKWSQFTTVLTETTAF